MSNENCLVKAIYSFKGKNNDELCFKKGDIITVTQKEEGGWWEGTLGETTGWFPSNYVTEHRDPSGSITTSPIRAASEIQAFRNVVLKDIIDSEKAHVAEMQGLVSNFLQPLENSDMLTRDEFKQLTGNINEVLGVHEQFLALLEECAIKTGPDQRVGGLFLQWAPKIKTVHQTYCASHPKAVCILDKYKEDLNTWMENAGAVCPGVLVLTAGLSKPFRRLGKYPAMLQELARHVHEAHPDRGDTHRASVVYKDIASGCAALRRQKELELQVVTGEVRGWPGGELATLGDVLHMGSVAVGPSHQDRYLVLFPTALLLLSVSKRVSAFVYEGCLPLTGITVCKLDDTDIRKNAFEISGPMIDTIVAVCQTKAEADNWVGLLQKHSNTSSPAHEPTQPQSLPHLARSPSEGALSSINTSRRSLYHVTLPPSTYPSASPYYSLTKYFARLVRKKVITRQMLRKLLHERTWAKAFELSGLPVKRRHRNHIKLKIGNDGTVDVDSDSGSEESDRESDNTEAYDTNSLCTDTEPNSSSRVLRQNAIDSFGPRTISSSCSSWEDNFGYVRYYDNSNDMQFNLIQQPIKGDCTKDIFNPDPITNTTRNSFHNNLQKSNRNNNLTVQHSDSAENSSFEGRNCMACEDLVNIDQNTQIGGTGNEENDFLLTRRSFPNCNIKNDSIPKLWKSTDEDYCRIEIDDECAVMSDLLKVLDPPSPKYSGDYPVDSIIIDPPPMFRNEDDDMKVINVSLNADVPFRKHSLNSDKKLRRSISKSMIEADKKHADAHLERMSSQSDNQKSRKKCECCNRSLCPSPRSSDSGVAGSCNLASPELNLHDYSNTGNNATDSDSHDKIDLTDSLHNLIQDTFDSRKLSLSDIEAATFEEQCRCTSPFGSTARTSCVTSVTSEMAMSDSSNDLSSGLTNHKRSHSFNNHQSYTQHTQQSQKNKQKNQSARWLLNSFDSLDHSPAKPNKIPIGKKFSSIDFIDSTPNYSSKGWSITCLRPAPPLRPQSFTVGSDENIGPTHPYAPHQRKSNSYEEDALILKVIEAYCTSARCRNAVSSECDDESPVSVEALARSPSLPIHSTSHHGSPSLWTIVMRLQNEVKTLKLDLINLQIQLKEEKQERILGIAAMQSKNMFRDAKESKC